MLLLLLLTTTTAFASTKDDAAIAAMRATHVKTAGARAVVWAPADWPAEKRAGLAASLDSVVAQVETTLGRKHEAPIEYFIASDEIPSHVYGGYAHQSSDRPVVFLSGFDSGEAPHIHETVHLVAGDFGSLLLREGIATYVQFTLQPGKMRPLLKLSATDLATLDAAVARLMATPETRQQALAWVAKPEKSVAFPSRADRSLFYAVSASFTAHLVRSLGMPAFMEAYGSENPVAAIERRSGKTWEQWTEEWLKKI